MESSLEKMERSQVYQGFGLWYEQVLRHCLTWFFLCFTACMLCYVFWCVLSSSVLPLKLVLLRTLHGSQSLVEGRDWSVVCLISMGARGWCRMKVTPSRTCAITYVRGWSLGCVCCHSLCSQCSRICISVVNVLKPVCCIFIAFTLTVVR